MSKANPYADNKIAKRERVVFEIAPEAMRLFDEAASKRGFYSRTEALRHVVVKAMTDWDNEAQQC